MTVSLSHSSSLTDMAITKEDVFRAADELEKAGQKPTLALIRQKIGGSYSTLSPLLREWKAAKTSADAPLQEPIPGSIAARLEDFGAELWRVALELADARLAAEREALEETRKQLESERDEAVELADSLSAEVERLTADLAAVRSEVESSRELIAELRGRLAALEPLLEQLKLRMGMVHETHDWIQVQSKEKEPKEPKPEQKPAQQQTQQPEPEEEELVGYCRLWDEYTEEEIEFRRRGRNC